MLCLGRQLGTAKTMQAPAARRLARTARHLCAGTAEAVPVEQPPLADAQRLSGARTGAHATAGRGLAAPDPPTPPG